MGQFNVPVYPDGIYCSHISSAEKRVKLYQNPVPESSLLQEYDLKFCFLDITVENDTVYVAGNVTLKAASIVPVLDTFAFELIQFMSVDSVFVNGVKHNFDHSSDLGTVPLMEGIPFGELFSVQIFYHGTPPSGEFFSGVTTGYSSNYDKHVTWTLSEPYEAKEWWPTKQDLQDKIDSVWVFLTTSQGNRAGSQGLLTAIIPLPDNKVRYEWKSHYPIDYYLVSFAVADYMDYSIYAYPAGTVDSVLIQNYIYNDPGCLAAYKGAIDQTAPDIELFSALFGMYPFIQEKYGHCLTQLAGGMENQTMTTIGGFNFGVVAHELGHMWFGDKVTCATWSDIWINEGFATYCDYLAHSYLTNAYYDSLWLKITNDRVKSQPGGSVYVPPEELWDEWRIFDSRLTYSKGALLLHMIRFELDDDEMFYHVLRTYVDEYGDSVATGDNFRDWLEEVSGSDFTDFFNQWYYGQGYPIYDITWHQSDGYFYLTATQTTSTSITPLFKMTMPYYLTFSDGTDTTLRLFQDANLNSYVVPISKTITGIQVDPKQWILYKLNSLSLGMEEPGNPVYFTIGPNPAKDIITIFFNHPVQKDFILQINDMEGRTVLEESVKDTEMKVDIRNLRSGVYICTIKNGMESLKRKLIVE